MNPARYTRAVVVEEARPGTEDAIKLTFGYDEHTMKPMNVVTGRVYHNADGDMEWSTRSGETGELADPRARKTLAANCKIVK